MLQLRNSLFFTFNGLDSKRNGWMVCNVSNDTTFNIGVDRSINSEDTNNGLLFRGVKDSNITFEVTLIKVDDKGNPSKINDDDIFLLNKWLFVAEPKALVVRDRKYKGIFKKCTGWMNEQNYGYVNFEFECDGYMYSNDINYTLFVDKEKTFEVKSKSNVNGQLSKPIITFTMLEGDLITITNLSNGNIIELTNLNIGDEYSIFNKQKQMINVTNPSDYMVYANSNKQYMSYMYGVNRIKIETNGKCKIRFSHEDKLGLQ